MIRVVTWTLGANPTPRSVATVLARLQPDVLLLGDLPGAGGLRGCLAGTGLRVVARSGRGRAGSAIAVVERMRARTSAQLRLRGTGAGNERLASHAIVGAGGRVLSLLAFRLGPDPDGRLADAHAITTFLAKVEHPDVIGGDIGEGPGGPVSDVLTGARLDAWTVGGVGTGLTYPTPEPMARHDVLLVDAGIPVAAAHVETAFPVDAAAKHRPVAVDIEEDQ